ncbi:FecR domain-containing protein [Carboxylicivirga sp. A043]|uniref:FecR family protein n=1 Tax=Carboxylicivirga litoralis TaxID=2816963 RepID=UPI0021CB1451|nr:FecR family protein [Carboxylicivirga sp. A043]MCU4154553.1 FecR domain-containing protein [Carboxylicivirga sp. A043]
MKKDIVSIDIELIRKKARHELSHEEEQHLEAWLSSDKANKAYYEKAQFYYKTKGVFNAQKIDREHAWNMVARRLKRGTNSLVKRWTVAAASVAAVVALVTLVTLVVKQPAEQVQVAQKVTAIEPGHRSAELILSNGQRVRLGQGSQELVEENGTTINLASEEAIYKADDQKASADDLQNTIRVDRGEEFTLVLADGTKVWINSMSELRFPVNFSKAVREVEILSGEACFAVAHDQQRPFIVKTPGHDVEVLGTTFNVSCYKNDEAIETTLVEGLIKISNQKGIPEPIIIEPNQQYVFSKTTLDANVRKVNASVYMAWTQGRFIFEDDSLESIFKKLERWYDIDVFFINNEKRNESFSGRLPRFENIDVILNMIEKVSDVEFNLQDNTVTIK